MKIGSRPICRIARTGEFTPPGNTRTARSYSSELRVFSFPPRVVGGEVTEADLLVLGRGIEGRAVLGTDSALGGNRVEDRVALLLGASMGHREDAVGPV